jgi:hypothetical protein
MVKACKWGRMYIATIFYLCISTASENAKIVFAIFAYKQNLSLNKHVNLNKWKYVCKRNDVTLFYKKIHRNLWKCTVALKNVNIGRTILKINVV